MEAGVNTREASRFLDHLESSFAKHEVCIAVTDGDATFTYASLWEKAGKLAESLLGRGFNPGDVIALALPRGWPLVVSMVAGVRAGLTLMPLDLASPPERTQRMLADASARAILGHKRSGRTQSAGDLPVLDVETLLSQDTGEKVPVLGGMAEDRTAFLFYTSGSTGRPKGVQVTTAGLLRLAMQPGYVPMAKGDRTACLSNTAFDAISFDVWTPLLTGGTCVIVPMDIADDADGFARWLESARIDRLFMTVALFNLLVEEVPTCFASLETVLIGGEQLNAAKVRAWYAANPQSRCTIHNVYGPTEHTTFALSYPIPRNHQGEVVPIGRPLPETVVKLRRPDGHPADPGEIAELLLGGSGLARGYLNRPEETARAFVVLQDGEETRRYYRTGDLVQLDADGLVRFVGRIDRQVKIRGFRVEPGEVEARLCELQGIRGVHVCVRKSSSGTLQLLAFLIADKDLDEVRYREQVAATLPRQMHPHASLLVDRFPLNANGKIDEAALLDLPARSVGEIDTTAMRPGSAHDDALRLVETILEQRPVDEGRTFLECGGDSLSAMRLASRISRQSGKRVQPGDLLNRTLTEIVELLAVPSSETAGPDRIWGTLSSAPASSEQLRLWLFQQVNPQSRAYDVPLVFHFDEHVDPGRLKDAFRKLARRHRSLRVRFCEQDGELRQVLEDWPDTGFSVREGDRWQDVADEVFRIPFDLGRPDLFRVFWVPSDRSGGTLLIHCHHIVIDGWSLTELLRDLSLLYATGNEMLLEPAGMDSLDFGNWQRAWRRGEDCRRSLEAACGATGQEGPVRDRLPAKPGPGRESAEIFQTRLSAEAADHLADFARVHGLTRFQVLQSALALSLGCVLGLDHFVMATPAANRAPSGALEGVGMYANTVLLPCHSVRTGNAGQAIVNQARRTARIMAHDSVLLEDLLADPVYRESVGTGDFDFLFVLETTDYDALKLGSAKADADFLRNAEAKCPLLVTAFDHGATVDFHWEAAVSRISGQVLRKIQDVFEGVLQALGDETARLDHLSASRSILVTAGGVSTSAGSRIIDAFDAAVAASPGTCALVTETGCTVSYEELLRRSNRLAATLHNDPRIAGCGDDALRVAIAMSGGAGHIVSLLALARLGLTVVPLDMSYPLQFQLQVLEQARPALILHDGTRDDVSEHAALSAQSHLLFDVNDVLPEPESQATPIQDGAPFYMLFTSGSTGVPKAVAVWEDLLWNLLAWQNKSSGGASTTQQFSKLSFDVSFQEILSTLCFGGTFCLLKSEWRTDMSALLDNIERHSVERIFMPYVALQILAEEGRSSARFPEELGEVIVAGEQLVCTSAIRAWFAGSPRARLVNQYGPTETHVVSAYSLEGASTDWPDTVPIGTAVPGFGLAVLNDAGEAVPFGQEGHLWIGGELIRRCYVGNADLNAFHFVSRDDLPGARTWLWYRSGDLAVMDADGCLSWTGRSDTQVKISGHRVELAQIEDVLRVASGNDNTIVQPNGEGRICAYFVGEPGIASETDLDNAIRVTLPAHVRVSSYRVLTEWPRAPSGKIDRRNLEQADWKPLRVQSGEDLPATNTIVAEVQACFAVVTGRSIAAGQTFFDAGATSLDLVRIKQKLGEHLGRNIAVTDLFSNPTPRAVAAALAGGQPVGRAFAAADGHSPELPRSADVAIVGMAFNLPGAATTDELGAMISGGLRGIERIGEDRGDHVAVRSQIEGLMDFDPGYFGISDAEAALMDPQQRHALLNAVQALADAGVDPDRSVAKIGIIASAGENIYFQQVLKHVDGKRLPDGFQLALHHDKDYLASKIAYRLGLTGPAYSVQTACSSSLVALHLGAQAVRSGDCDIVVVTGVLADPTLTEGYRYRPNHIFSKDGTCRPFDRLASGTIGASGVCSVVLKSAPVAMQDGSRLHALLLGSAINNDGRAKMGYAAPSAEGQADAIKRAMRQAGLTAADIGFVETHGTGTALGDPIEIKGLSIAYGGEHPVVPLTSFKSQIGHLGAAAGLAGVIRAISAMRIGMLPPCLHFSEENGETGLSALGFRVVAQAEPWSSDRPMIAGISSFGIGGTNAHAVLGAAPPLSVKQEQTADRPVLLLSAAALTVLRSWAGLIADYLERHPGQLPQVLRHLRLGQRHLAFRTAALCPDCETAIGFLRSVEKGETPSAPVDPDLADWQNGGLWIENGIGPSPDDFPAYPFECRRFNLLETNGQPAIVEPSETAKRSDPEDWLYQECWIEAGRLRSRDENTGRILVVQSLERLPEQTVRLLESTYKAVEWLPLEEPVGFGQAREFLKGLLQRYPDTKGVEWVHAGALGVEAGRTRQALLRGEQLCVDGLAATGQELANAGPADLRLVALSRNAAPVSGSEPFTSACVLGSVLPVLRQETGLSTLWIDVDEQEMSAGLLAALPHLLELHRTDKLAVRGRKLFAARMMPARENPSGGASMFPDGLYLVLGGTGGIGASLALEILSQTNTRVLLVGRSATDVMPEMAGYEGRVRTLRADLVTLEGRQQVKQALRDEAGPLAGIVHAVGLGHGALLAHRNAAEQRKLRAPKIETAIFCEELIGEFSPQFVLYCSSMAAHFGGVGQFDYAATNAVLDALAVMDADTGVGTQRLSINWDIWSEAGMAVRSTVGGKTHAEHLAVGLSNADGRDVFRRCVTSGLPRVLVSTVDPENAASRFYGAVNSADLRSARHTQETSAATVVRHLKQLLDCETVTEADLLSDLGVDSLATIELLEGLEKELGIRVNIAAIGPRSCISDIAALLSSEVRAAKVEKPLPQAEIWRWPAGGPMVCFVHPVGGDVQCYHDLANALPSETGICVISDPSLISPGEIHETLRQKANCYLDELQAAVEPFAGAWILAGWSFGACVAHEMVRLLEEEGRHIAGLWMIDPPPHPEGGGLATLNEISLDAVLDSELATVSRTHSGSETVGAPDGDYVAKVRGACIRNIGLLRSWRPGRIAVPTQIFLAKQGSSLKGAVFEKPAAQQRNWSRSLGSKTSFHLLDADHYGIVEKPAVSQISDLLLSMIDRKTVAGEAAE